MADPEAGDSGSSEERTVSLAWYGNSVTVSKSFLEGWSIPELPNLFTRVMPFTELRYDAEAARVAEQQREATCRSRRRHNRERWQAVMDTAVALYGAGTVLCQVIDLHEPDDVAWWQRACQGCSGEVSGYEYELEDWPCQTFLTMETALADPVTHG